MPRIMAIDYGQKRVGLAVTDPLKIIASPLDTVPTSGIMQFLDQYLAKEEVEKIIIGMPYRADGSLPQWADQIQSFAEKLQKKFPDIEIEFVDERYTSKMAQQALISGGFKKKDRRKKENLDRISATIMLQEYLGII